LEINFAIAITGCIPENELTAWSLLFVSRYCFSFWFPCLTVVCCCCKKYAPLRAIGCCASWSVDFPKVD
jgi:hypothetical protein